MEGRKKAMNGLYCDFIIYAFDNPTRGLPGKA